MMQPQIMPQIPSLIMGLIAFVLGLVPILATFGFIPFAIPTIPEMVYQGVLAVGGLLLILDYALGFSLA